MVDELYTIKYFGDEARVVLSKCLSPDCCTCISSKERTEVKCCMSAEEARQKVIEYYVNRANQIKNQPIDEFLYDQGFYL